LDFSIIKLDKSVFEGGEGGMSGGWPCSAPGGNMGVGGIGVYESGEFYPRAQGGPEN